MGMVKMTFTLDEATVARLRGSAERLARPQSEIVRDAICDYAERIGRTGEAEIRFPVFQIREAFLCNGVEENRQKLVSAANAAIVPYKPNAFITVRLKPNRLAQKTAAR